MLLPYRIPRSSNTQKKQKTSNHTQYDFKKTTNEPLKNRKKELKAGNLKDDIATQGIILIERDFSSN